MQSTNKTGLLLVLGLLVAGCALLMWSVIRLGGWRYLAHRLHTQDGWPSYTQRISQLERLPPAQNGVLLIGDSHIAHGEWSELLPAHKTFNRGVPGEGTTRLFRSSYLRQAQHQSTTGVVLQVGTNDLLFDEVVPESYDSLLSSLGAARLPIFVCTLPGVNNEVRWTGIDPAHVARFNGHIRQVCAGDPQLQLVDLARALGTEDGVLPPEFTDDGVHLRGNGYVTWAEILAARLPRSAALPQKD